MNFSVKWTLQINKSYPSFHLHFEKRLLGSRGSPSHPHISGTSGGPGPVGPSCCVDALDANVF